MKADTIRYLYAQRCSAQEIALAVGMEPCRVREFIARGLRWPRHRAAREGIALNRLAMRCGF